MMTGLIDDMKNLYLESKTSTPPSSSLTPSGSRILPSSNNLNNFSSLSLGNFNTNSNNNNNNNLPSVSITVTVSQARNLCSYKGDSFPIHSSVKIIFGDQDTVDSEVVKDSKNPVYNHSRVYQRVVDDSLLNDLINRPLSIVIMEGITSHKTIMGSAEVDLHPLAGGETKLYSWYQLNNSANSSLELISSEVEITVSVSHMILAPEEYQNGNLLTVNIDSAYSLPDKWIIKNSDLANNPFKYVLRFTIPSFTSDVADVVAEGNLGSANDELDDEDHGHASDLPHTKSFGRGRSQKAPAALLKSPSVKPTAPQSQSLSTHVTDKGIPVSQRVSDEEMMFYHQAETSGQRVKWDHNQRVFLRASTLEKWKNEILMNSGMNVVISDSVPALSSLELRRVLKPQYQGFRDYNEKRYHGEARLDLTPLLEPGVSNFTARVRIGPWNKVEKDDFSLNSNANINSMAFDGEVPDIEFENPDTEGEFLSTANAQSNNSAITNSPTTGKLKKKKRKSKSPSRRSTTELSVQSEPQNNNNNNNNNNSISTKETSQSSPNLETPFTTENSNTNTPAVTKKKSKKKRGSNSPEKEKPAILPSVTNVASSVSVSSSPEKNPSSIALSTELMAKKKIKGKKRRELEKLLKPEEEDDEGRPIATSQVCPYELSHTYIVVTLSLAKPLVPKAPTPRRIPKPSDYIPKRPPLPRFLHMREASEEFSAQIQAIVKDLAEEYKKLFGVPTKEPSEKERDERKRQFLFELNTNGKYYSFKEKLKWSIVRIVKEKFHKTNFSSKNELDLFLTDLYVYLVDQMHATLTRTLERESLPVLSKSILSNTSVSPLLVLKRFAEEAEMVFNFPLASKYHQERILKNRHDPNLWYDFGSFALRSGDSAKAEECFRESVSLDPTHVATLTIYGALLLDKNDLEKSEAFLFAAIDPSSISGWKGGIPQSKSKRILNSVGSFSTIAQTGKGKEKSVVLGLLGYLYNLQEREEESILMYTQALRHFTTDQEYLASVPPPQTLPSLGPLHLHIAKALLDLFLPSLAEKILDLDLSGNPNGLSSSEKQVSSEDAEIWGKLFLIKGEYARAEEVIKESLAMDTRNPATWSLAAHLHYLQAHTQEAITSYETAFALLAQNEKMNEHNNLGSRTIPLSAPVKKDASMLLNISRDINQSLSSLDLSTLDFSMILRLGELYMTVADYSKSKDVFLRACGVRPTSSYSWLGVGIACYRMDDLITAEESLAEANIQNNHDPEVWGYLTLLCLKSKRESEAYLSLREALRLGLSNPILLRDIAESYINLNDVTDLNEEKINENSINIAERCLETAFPLLKDDSHTNRLLGDINSFKDNIEQAASYYRNVVQLTQDSLNSTNNAFKKAHSNKNQVKEDRVHSLTKLQSISNLLKDFDQVSYYQTLLEQCE